MINLYEARSLLYRRQFLQENIRWKALDEIFKIDMLLHRSDLKMLANLRHIILWLDPTIQPGQIIRAKSGLTPS